MHYQQNQKKGSRSWEEGWRSWEEGSRSWKKQAQRKITVTTFITYKTALEGAEFDVKVKAGLELVKADESRNRHN